MRWSVLLLGLLLIPSIAVAAPGRRVIVDTPAPIAAPATTGISHTIYLERCRGDCTLQKSATNDARTLASSIPSGTGPFRISEYRNSMGEVGPAADAEWAELVQCMREVYSPYDVTVTDVKPTEGTYHVALIAGVPGEAGLAGDILGIAPLAGNCAPQDNVISFSFANAHSSSDRVHNVCWTAAQESAHAFGLDHEYEFQDHRSACSDPMTYRVDCGGQRFFRNIAATCGENAARPCKCTATQNSHQKLISVFGPGTPITTPPTAMLTLPNGSQPLGVNTATQAGSQRGIVKVELRFNGFAWASVPGLAFGPTGQPNPGTYAIMVPANLPKGVVDVSTRAYDDLGTFTDSQTVTVNNGPPCETAATCAAHQKCEAGRCFWDAPTGEIGADCSYPQQCKSGMCMGTSDQQICTEACVPSNDTCPGDLICVDTGGDAGICFSTGGGCCSVGRGGSVPWPQIGVGVLALALATRRRRR